MFTKGQLITLVVIAVAFALMVAGCAPTATASETLLNSINEFNAGNLEKSAEYYADDALVKLNGVPPGEKDTFKGKAEVLAWFKDLATQHFEIKVEILKVEGDTITTKTQTWMDATRALGVAPMVGTEVYVVKDGKIKSETYTVTPESAAKLQAAIAKAQAAAQPTPAPTASAPTVSVPKALIGKYKTTITEKDARDQNYPLSFGDVVGEFETQFMEGGRLLVKFQGSGVVTGEFTATQDTIVFGKESGPYACTKDGYGSGTYKWSSDGKSLTLTKVDDSCPGRILVFTAHPLGKVQ